MYTVSNGKFVNLLLPATVLAFATSADNDQPAH